jgi:hypothetical protein
MVGELRTKSCLLGLVFNPGGTDVVVREQCFRRAMEWLFRNQSSTRRDWLRMPSRDGWDAIDSPPDEEFPCNAMQSPTS